MSLKPEAIAAPSIDGLWKSDVWGLLVHISSPCDTCDAQGSCSSSGSGGCYQEYSTDTPSIPHCYLDVIRGNPEFVVLYLRLNAVMPRKNVHLHVSSLTPLNARRFMVGCTVREE